MKKNHFVKCYLNVEKRKLLKMRKNGISKIVLLVVTYLCKQRSGKTRKLTSVKVVKFEKKFCYNL